MVEIFTCKTEHLYFRIHVHCEMVLDKLTVVIRSRLYPPYLLPQFVSRLYLRGITPFTTLLGKVHLKYTILKLNSCGLQNVTLQKYFDY